MLTPSTAHLWVRCSLAGNVLATGEYYATPDPDNVHADQTDAQREGICAHWAAELVFTGWVQNAGELIGISHVNGWTVDDEMAGHVQDYVDYVRCYSRVTVTETPVNLFNGLINGRLDTATASDDAVIRVFDLKYGWKQVEAEENYAMLCYGLDRAMQTGAALELHIYQPRGNHPDGPHRVWEIPAAEVPVWAMWLEDKARACFDAPTGTPGYQCLNCPARGSCAALTKNVFAAYELLTDDRMQDHSPEELGAFMTFLNTAADLVKAKLGGIEAEATARMKRGTFIPHWTLEERRGNRRFTLPIEKLEMAVGISPYKTVAMSPAEMERAGIPKEIVNMISERPTIGRKLTNNPENIAKRLFGK